MSAPELLEFFHDSVSEKAAAFLERRRSGEWSDDDQATLRAWLAESLLHRAAYLRVEGAVAYAEHLATTHEFKVTPRQDRTAAGRDVIWSRLKMPILIAATIALAATAGLVYLSSSAPPPDRAYSTDIGGRTLLKFADGTVVDLDTDTALRIRMTSAQRMVWLDRGEAWFHVAHNAANPFTVIVGKHRVTDVGTEFLVRRRVSALEVALLNGKAALSTEGAPIAMLAPGDDAIATSASMSVTRKTRQQLADELAWRRGALVFRSSRLVDAVKEINRYNQTKIVIADPSISDLKFTGEIRSDGESDFLFLAQTMMGLHVDRRGEDILLSRAMTAKTHSAARTSREP